MESDQMELSLEAEITPLARQARRQRRERAQWWFAQMRRVVGAAMEWSPQAQGRQEQGCLALATKRP